jgi:hypothetical protein
VCARLDVCLCLALVSLPRYMTGAVSIAGGHSCATSTPILFANEPKSTRLLARPSSDSVEQLPRCRCSCDVCNRVIVNVSRSSAV